MTDSKDKRPELERFRELMTGALDDELSPTEQQEFERLLATSPEHRQQWEEFKKVKEMTMQLKLKQPGQEVWDYYWMGVYRRLERGLGWILVSLGAIALLFYGGYQAVESILGDAHLPALIKAAILTLMAGGIVLFVSVVREKLFAAKTDKYKDIQR